MSIREKEKSGYFLILPVLVVIVFITMYALVNTIRLSFYEWELYLGPKPQAFIGLENYKRMLFDSGFRNSLRVTGLFVGASVGLEILLGLLIALLLNRERKVHRFVRKILILPFVVSPALMGISWRFFLNPDFGIFDYLLKLIFHVDKRFIWLADVTWAWIAVLCADIWQYTPFVILIMSAGLASIPQEVYDAAHVDGANGWELFRFVTLPFLVPSLVVALIIKSIYSVKVFDTVVLLTGGGPGAATDLLSFHVYKVGFNFYHMGDAAARSIFLAMILSILVLLYIKFLPKGSLN